MTPFRWLNFPVKITALLGAQMELVTKRVLKFHTISGNTIPMFWSLVN